MIANLNELKRGVYFLAPGFVSFFVYGQLVDTKNTKEVEFLFFLIFLTVISLIVTRLALDFFSLFRKSKIDGSSEHPFVVSFRLLVGACLGLMFAILTQGNYFYHLVNGVFPVSGVEIAGRGQPVPYLFELNSRGKPVDFRPRKSSAERQYIRVTLSSGEIVSGKPVLYSGETKSSEMQIYLSPACVAEKEPSGYVTHAKSDGAGVIVTMNKVELMVFEDRFRNSCYCAWYPKLCQKMNSLGKSRQGEPK